jgi:putative transposase
VAAYRSWSHGVGIRKYRIVFIPKQRRKKLHAELHRHLGAVFRQLASQNDREMLEGRPMPDHVHMMIAMPPEHAVSQIVGCSKGKRASDLALVYGERECNVVGRHCWAPGKFASTVGRDEALLREDIHNPEKDHGCFEQRLITERPAMTWDIYQQY